MPGNIIAFDIFYHLDAADRRRFRDYTGCGMNVGPPWQAE